jgi:2'-5' RNA ligase
MHAVVSLLDKIHSARVETIWKELEVKCGLTGIKATPIPHFSWHVARDYDFSRLQPVLEKLSSSAKPFTVRATGLGLFTRESPVLYIPLVRDPLLSEFHRVIWKTVISLSDAPSPHYAPDAWIPHITLAYGDLNRKALSCAVGKLAFEADNWDIKIDNLAVVYQLDSLVGKLDYQLQFTG